MTGKSKLQTVLSRPYKNKNDKKILKKLIKKQRAKGADLDKDINNEFCYTWNRYTGRLEEIDWSYGELKGKVKFTGLSKLKVLRCNCNNITKLDVSGLKNLRDLDCSENKIRELDVSKLKKLKNLDCRYNKITKLDIRKLKKLKKSYGLYCDKKVEVIGR